MVRTLTSVSNLGVNLQLKISSVTYQGDFGLELHCVVLQARMISRQQSTPFLFVDATTQLFTSTHHNTNKYKFGNTIKVFIVHRRDSVSPSPYYLSFPPSRDHILSLFVVRCSLVARFSYLFRKTMRVRSVNLYSTHASIIKRSLCDHAS